MRRATIFAARQAAVGVFLSTLSLRRATWAKALFRYLGIISIHALLAESDAIDVFLAVWAVISIHALLAESDRLLMCFWLSGLLFLSTLSLRRATCSRCTTSHRRVYFYPRSPCGERLGIPNQAGTWEVISIHALLAESDKIPYATSELILEFLSTLSLRRATVGGRVLFRTPGHISIHALLAESDMPHVGTSFSLLLFLSTLSLRRATSSLYLPLLFGLQFLSTLSLRRATP